MARKASATYTEKVTGPRKKKQHEDASSDIFQTILNSSLPIEEKRPKRLANEVFNLLIAGSLTTSKTAAIAVYHILENPEVCKRLKTELSVAIPDKYTMPDVRTLQTLPMLVRKFMPLR